MNASFKTIVITGVSRGLGYALAREFCNEGHLVYGCSRNLGEAGDLIESYPENFFYREVELTQYSLVEQWAKETVYKARSIDFLINNASIINRNASCWELSHKEIQQVMDINVNAVFSCIQSFLPCMMENKQGMIVNMSSGWGKEGAAGLSPYCASKFAIEGLTQAISKELPKGVGMVSLDPGGGIQTEMLFSCLPDFYKHAPTTTKWASVAAPYILNLTAKQNGAALTCPSVS